MKLLRSVSRGSSGSEVYGHAGDDVMLIADHGNMLIVQHKNGERFPVLKIDVLPDIVVPDENFTPPILPHHLNPQPDPRPKKTKAANPNQPTLF